MKRLLIVSWAIVGLAACTSNPHKPVTEHRNPNSFGDSVANVSDASAGLASDTIHAVINVTKISGHASEDIAASDRGPLGPFTVSSGASKEVAIIGWALGKKTSAVVVVSASEAGRASEASINQVVTTSGEILSAAVDSSKTAIGVTVDLSKEAYLGTKDLVVKVGRYTLGTVKLSADKAAQVAAWISANTSQASAWSVDKGGKLYHSSKDAVGDVLDLSGDVVSFVVDQSGQILTVSKDVSVAVVKGAGVSIKQLALDSKDLALKSANGSKKAGKFIVGKVVSSAQGSFVLVEWSVNGIKRSSKYVSDSISNLLHSTPEDRPDSGSGSAVAPGSGSQSN